MLRAPLPLYPVVVFRSALALTAEHSADRVAIRSSQNFPPIRSNAPGFSPLLPHAGVHADAFGTVLVQTVTQLADQVASQSAAQISAFFAMMRQLEEMRSALPQNPSIRARSPFQSSAHGVHTLANAPSSRFSAPSAPTPIYLTVTQANAYAPFAAALPPRPQTIAPFALSTISTDAGQTAYAPNPQSILPLSQFMPAPVVPVSSTVAAPALHALAYSQPAAHTPAVIPHRAVSAERTVVSVGRRSSAVHSRRACCAAVCDAHPR